MTQHGREFASDASLHQGAFGLFVGWVRRRRQVGYLCLDDCVIEKAFARRLPWAGWTYSFAKKRKVYGLHVVVLL
jgi:hypothetical protein